MAALLNMRTDNLTTKLQLHVEDDEAEAQAQHPCCPHGPTILFGTTTNGYYACSAFRDRKLCKFQMPSTEWRGGNAIKRKNTAREYPKHPTNSSELNCDPTSNNHLLPLSKNEEHAQYFFDDKALKFLTDQFGLLKISKVVCMGAPRLHFHLRKMKSFKSFLLDLDERFAAYLTPQEFCLFNMCNNYYFYNSDNFHKFLQCNNKNERILIVTDPPFGCRTELIAHTLRSLIRRHNQVNMKCHQPLAIFWIYPYYTANYIQQEMPEMEMCDYKINYTNHQHYTDIGKAKRSYGSPVRVFHNVPSELLHLPAAEGYKYCGKCRRHTAIENVHCERGTCNTCPSRNGQTYRHCEHCKICVKPNYVHCMHCRRCTQSEGHQCAIYQSKQHCWLCRNVGHIETDCFIWKTTTRKMMRRKYSCCLICGGKTHNELKCTKRRVFFKEYQFMGNIFTSPKGVVVDK